MNITEAAQILFDGTILRRYTRVDYGNHKLLSNIFYRIKGNDLHISHFPNFVDYDSRPILFTFEEVIDCNWQFLTLAQKNST